MIKNSDRALILSEALPYIKKYIGKTVVIKYGGNAMIDKEITDSIISDIVLLTMVGVKVVLVHGGGPDINKMLQRLNIESEFIDGLRKTTDEVMEITQMVLCGKTNKNLVNLICKSGGKAVGLSGIDCSMVKAQKKNEQLINVGEISKINPEILNDLLEKNYIPVVSSVAYSDGGNLNINADTFASHISVAVKADKLILLTDVCGVLQDANDVSSLIPVIRVSEVPKLIHDGVISGGMIPKVHCCTYATRNGVSQTNILSGTKKHSILIELLSDNGSGTLFC